MHDIKNEKNGQNLHKRKNTCLDLIANKLQLRVKSHLDRDLVFWCAFQTQQPKRISNEALWKTPSIRCCCGRRCFCVSCGEWFGWAAGNLPLRGGAFLVNPPPGGQALFSQGGGESGRDPHLSFWVRTRRGGGCPEEVLAFRPAWIQVYSGAPWATIIVEQTPSTNNHLGIFDSKPTCKPPSEKLLSVTTPYPRVWENKINLRCRRCRRKKMDFLWHPYVSNLHLTGNPGEKPTSSIFKQPVAPNPNEFHDKWTTSGEMVAKGSPGSSTLLVCKARDRVWIGDVKEGPGSYSWGVKRESLRMKSRNAIGKKRTGHTNRGQWWSTEGYECEMESILRSRIW